MSRIERWKIILVAILAAGGALRLTAALRCGIAPDYSDMAIYNGLALSGGIPLSPPPGYPLFLRAIYAVAGSEDYTAVFVVQALIGTLTVWLIFLTARRVAGTATALVASGIAAVYPGFIMYTLTTMTETLALMLTMLMLLAVAAPGKGALRSALPAALLFAGCVVRPAFLYFWPGMLAAVRGKRTFLIVTAAVIVPLLAAGLITGRGTNRGALAFYKSYNARSDGKAWFDLKETELGTRDLPSSVYLRESMRFIAENRWKTLDIIYVKASNVFSRGYDTFILRPLTGGSRSLHQIMQYAYLPVMILGFIGMIRFSDRRSRRIMLPALSYLLFFIILAIFKMRYRLLAEPAFIIFTAVTIGHICGFQELGDSSEEPSAV